MIEINKHPSPRELSWFAVLFAIFVGGVGFLLRHSLGHPTAGLVLWGVGLVALLAFVLVPRWRTPLYLGWMYLFFPLGFVLSHVVLALVYYAVLTPVGLGMRLFGRDPMMRRFEPERTSYWIARGPEAETGRYFRQF